MVNFFSRLKSMIGAATPQPQLPEPQATYRRVVVKVVAYDSAGAISAEGSGVLIPQPGDETHIVLVTIRHLLLGASHAEAVMSDGTAHAIDAVLAEDIGSDLLLLALAIPTELYAPLLVKDRAPEMAQPVTLISAGEQPVRESKISASCHMPDDETFTPFAINERLDASEIGGPVINERLDASEIGGPVINERDEVIGIAASACGESSAVMPALRILSLALSTPQPVIVWARSAGSDWKKSPAGLLFTVRCCLAVNDFSRARAVAEALTTAEASCVTGWLCLGISHQFFGDGERALADFQHAVQLQPTLSEGYFLLAGAQAYLKRYDDALAAYSQAIQLNPNEAKSYRGLGKVYLRLKEYRKAGEVLARAVELNPRDANAQYDLGYCYLQLGDKLAAETQVRLLARLDPALAADLDLERKLV